MIEIIFLIVGLLLLWIGAELIVNGVASIALHYKVSPFFLGLTLLAVGTDLPETFIVVMGSIQQYLGTDSSSLLIGEIIGSSVSQISLILGLTGIFGTLVIKKNKVFRDGVMLVASVVVLFLMLFDGQIVWYEGLVLLILYGVYVGTLLRDEKVYQNIVLKKPEYSLRWAAVSMIGGLVLLLFASHITLENALKLAETWNLPQVFVGSVIVGLGTSLPELVTAIQAARKKVVGLALGGLIGSNIYDVLVPIGLGAIIAPMAVPERVLFFDLPFLFVTSGIVLLFLRKDYTMTLRESSVLIGMYACYIIIQILGI